MQNSLAYFGGVFAKSIVDGSQSIRPAAEKFRQVIRDSEPDFRPYERKVARTKPEIHQFVTPSFLANEGIPFTPSDDRKAIYIDDVMKRAQE